MGRSKQKHTEKKQLKLNKEPFFFSTSGYKKIYVWTAFSHRNIILNLSVLLLQIFLDEMLWRRIISLISILSTHFENSSQLLLQRGHTNFYHIKKHEHLTVFPLPATPFVFSNGLCVSALPARQSSFPDRKSLQGLSPHHRWPFNTSLATANEPGVAAAWLDPADFAQMFISHSPAVLGWEMHFNLGSIFTLFIYFYLFVTGSRHFKFCLKLVVHLQRDVFHYLLFPDTLLNKQHLAWFPRNRCSLDENFSFANLLFWIFFLGAGKRADARRAFFFNPLLLPHRNL